MCKDRLVYDSRPASRLAGRLAGFGYRAAIAATAVIVTTQLVAWSLPRQTTAIAFLEADRTLALGEAESIREAILKSARPFPERRPPGAAVVEVRVLDAPDGKTRWGVAATDADERSAMERAAEVAGRFAEQENASDRTALDMDALRGGAAAAHLRLQALAARVRELTADAEEVAPAIDDLLSQEQARDELDKETEAPTTALDASSAARAELSDLLRIQAELASRMTGRHPQLAALERRIASLRRVVESADADHRTASVAANESISAEEEASLLADSLRVALAAVGRLQDADLDSALVAAQDSVQALISAVAAAETTETSDRPTYRVVVPRRRAATAGIPWGVESLAAALLLGLIAGALGTGGAAARMQNLAADTGLPLLGVVPAADCQWTMRRGLAGSAVRGAAKSFVILCHVVVVAGSLVLALLVAAG